MQTSGSSTCTAGDTELHTQIIAGDTELHTQTIAGDTDQTHDWSVKSSVQDMQKSATIVA